MNTKIQFNLPDYLPTRKVLWNNTNATFVIGPNGTGKTILLNMMADWAYSHNYTYNFYNALTAIDEAPALIDNASDDDIIYVCKMMSEFSMDFNDDIMGWAKAKNNHTYDQIGDFHQDADLLRDVLRMCGSGYTRMFVLLYLGGQDTGIDYYFLDMPETSMHMVIAQKIINILMNNFPYTKFVISTHSPEVISGNWHDNNVIELKTDYIKDCQDFKFDEVFG